MHLEKGTSKREDCDEAGCAQERGFVHSCTNIAELDKKMSEGVVTAYLGPSSSLVWVWRTLSSVSVYLVSPVWWVRALFRSKVDGFVPHTHYVNIQIGSNPECGRAGIFSAPPPPLEPLY